MKNGSNGDILLKLGKILANTNNLNDLNKLCEATLILLLQNPKVPQRNMDKMKTFVNELCCKFDKLIKSEELTESTENFILLLNH